MANSTDYRRHNIGTVITAGQADGFSFGHWLADTWGDAVVPHGHHDAQIMLATAGPYFTAAKGTPPSDHGALVFNPAQTWHHDRFLGPGSFFAITIPAERFETLDEFEPPATPTLIAGLAPRALLASLMRECARWDVDSEMAAEALCFELMGILSRRAPNERLRPAWIGRAVEIIEDRLAEPLSLGTIAMAVSVHPVHLTRTFRKFLHCTPGEYLRNRRVQRAAQLLAGSEKALPEIALATGHSDQSHLTRHFRGVYGLPPGAYRAQAGVSPRRSHVCSVQDPGADSRAN